MSAADPRNSVGEMPGCIEDVIGKETGTYVLIRSRIYRVCRVAVAGKTDSWKGAILCCINGKTERCRIERISSITIRDVVPRKPDIEVIQEGGSKCVIVLNTNKN